MYIYVYVHAYVYACPSEAHFSHMSELRATQPLHKYIVLYVYIFWRVFRQVQFDHVKKKKSAYKWEFHSQRAPAYKGIFIHEYPIFLCTTLSTYYLRNLREQIVRARLFLRSECCVCTYVRSIILCYVYAYKNHLTVHYTYIHMYVPSTSLYSHCMHIPRARVNIWTTARRSTIRRSTIRWLVKSRSPQL